MKALLITSSVLTVVILLLRWLFRGKVSQKLIYAAWLLVAARLLIPIQFGQSPYSITALTEKIETQSPSIQQAQDVLDAPVAGPTREELYEQLLGEYMQQNHQPVTPEIEEQIQIEAAEQITAPSVSDVLTGIWIGGIAVMAVWFLGANLVFLRRAKTGATPFPCEAPVPVWLSDKVSSPCLVGLFRPTIYLTPASTEAPQALNHILTHEITHLRHWDHIWSVLRCVCLCVYWFDPLVWTAAILSRRDCELACDESALKTLGDGERIAYGKTLLATVSQNSSHVFEIATAMGESKKQLKQRISYIISKPRNLLICVICLALVASITVGCTFAGGAPRSLATPPTATEPTDDASVTAPPPVTQPTTPPPTTPTTPPNVTDPTVSSSVLVPLTPEDIPRTIQLAKEKLGMTYCEFLYTANRIVDGYISSRKVDESMKQTAKTGLVWDASAIRSRTLYVDDTGTLMMSFSCRSLLADTDPLYGTRYVKFAPEDYGWERPVALKNNSYQWLFMMNDHVDGFSADSYNFLMLDCFFQEPDLFLRLLSERDEETIRTIALGIHYAIASQEEHTLFTQLLLAISARSDLTDAEKAAMSTLKTAIAEDCPFETPKTPASNIRYLLVESKQYHFNGDLNISRSYTYDDCGRRLTSLYSSQGNQRRYTYTYNEHGHMISAHYQEINTNSSADDFASTTTFTYTYNPDGTIAKMEDSEGYEKKFKYDSEGRVIHISAFKVEHEMTYNAKGQLTEVLYNLWEPNPPVFPSRPTGDGCFFRYDDQGRILSSQKGWWIGQDGTCLADVITNYTYRDTGVTIHQKMLDYPYRQTIYHAETGLGVYIDRQYAEDYTGSTASFITDSNGNISTILYSDGTRTEFRYEAVAVPDGTKFPTYFNWMNQPITIADCYEDILFYFLPRP